MAIEEGTGAPVSSAEQKAELLEDLTFEAFGEGFEPAWDVHDTSERIANATRFSRPNRAPQALQPFECRIGATKLFIPPLNINVNQRFKAGGMVGSSIRQQNSPKFSTGQSETVVEMTLYFPTVDTIWGVENQGPYNMLEIDFDNIHTPDSVIDDFLSSLRGLVTQFKYAPFLPVKNQYLNQVFNITGVALKDMTIGTVPSFPNCMAVNLTLLKFNHKTYLPMINDFDQAIHWGRFRQYMGRAAAKLNQQTKPFKIFDPSNDAIGEPTSDNQIDMPIKMAETVLSDSRGIDYTSAQKFFRPTTQSVSRLDFYYPFHTPAEVDIPDLDDLKPEEIDVSARDKRWWENILSGLGIQVDVYADAEYERLRKINEEKDETYYANLDEYKLLVEYFKSNSLRLDDMGPDALEEFINDQIKDHPGEATSEVKREIRLRAQEAWFVAMFRFAAESPAIAAQLSRDDKKRRQLTIDEWEIPMWKLGLNYDYITVEGVSVSLGNAFARLQLQMQDEPTHQHIGGEDTRVDISMTFHGEDAERELVKLRNMFDSIKGLARLEQSHGVLGFLGVKNVITQLVGMTYAVPLNFSVDTVPGYPHVYKVTISLVDFDVFQQKREQLTATQQAELVAEFGKRNPFLRLKQMWGHFNAYPDFPLSVRDKEGDIIGHLDPDYYFRSFKPIDDDIVQTNPTPKKETIEDGIKELDARQRAGEVNIVLGDVDGKTQSAIVDDDGIFMRDGDDFVGQLSPSSGEAPGVTKPTVDGLTPLSGYDERYPGGSSDPRFQFETMAKDMQYRDKSGRMVRAFPTYMLWIIDEGGNFAGMKLFDNFYGLQSLLDLSIVRSEDIMADTLVMKLSNLYSKLSTEFSAYLDEDSPAAEFYNKNQTELLRYATGLGTYLVDLQSIQLKPGVRVHLRMGYSANPNNLETVFNGRISEVQTGDILTVVAESDAAELGQLVNSTNEKGHTGKIDGSMTGLYMSEPRDLMTTLLTQGSSVVKEVIAHSTRGQIFSDNRYGIKHFGSMLYTPLTQGEVDKERRVKTTLSNRIAENGTQSGIIEGGISFVDVAMQTIMTDMWVNLSARRDYEVFKRNIYPGNGTGVAQYLGGDIGDIALTVAQDGTNAFTTSTGYGSENTATDFDPTTGETTSYNIDDAIEAAKISTGELNENGEVPTPPNPALEGLKKSARFGAEQVWTYSQQDKVGLHNLLRTFGISSEDDDFGDSDEVSFRAQTYMKTVWDLFKVCAALLPDYIVAVRPFEERSTVFYGKPHWLYTSGLIPLSRGVHPKDGPDIVEMDEELLKYMEKLQAESEKSKDKFGDDLIGAVRSVTPSVGLDYDPTASVGGMKWDGTPESVLSAPSAYPELELPFTQGPVGIEMHLPTDPDLDTDIKQHKQIDALPPNLRHPFYMDRVDGPRGGYTGTKEYDPRGGTYQDSVLGEDGRLAGQDSGAFAGYLTPEEEQWYMCQYWPLKKDVNGSQSKWQGRRILVYCERTKKGVVCTPGDAGPNYKKVTQGSRGVVAGISPDGWWALGQPTDNDMCYYQIMPDDTPLGPIEFGDTVSSSSGYDNVANTRQETVSDVDPEDLPSWANGSTDLKQVSLENGYKAGSGIPVNYTQNLDPTSTSNGETAYRYYDEIGQIAQMAYQGHRTTNEANDIWEEFRRRFKDYARDVYVQSAAFKHLSEEEREKLYTEEYDDDYLTRVVDFQKYLWQNAHARGWVVKVFNPESQLFNVGDLADGDDDNWSQSSLFDAFAAYLDGGEENLETYMSVNQDDGYQSAVPLLRRYEEVARSALDIKDSITNAIGSIGAVASGLIDTLRLSIYQLTAGMGLASDMQKRTNLLNSVYNDSIYYSEGLSSDGTIENRLLYYADNPFTREYGEPVAEIREPFQRMHHINSFRHIVNNGIFETMDNVATVITATSNGGNPVTVHFDKGMSPERQIEKTVETGLFYDDVSFWGHLNPFNALQSAREEQLDQAGHSPEISAKRVALWHLKENLKDIYQGELTLIGDPTIRPYDICYLADVQERMYGFFEAEQVVHHLSPSTGFVTTVTPNACVTINDPGRFYLMANWQGKHAVAQLRDEIRQRMGVQADNEGIDAGTSADTTVDDIADDVEDALLGTGQFYGGTSALLKSMTSLGPVTGSLAVGGATAAASATVIGLPFAFFGWKAWEWVRDNLLDQHGCYINYLTRHGSPMDSSLSYTQGVSVGSQNSVGLVLKGLKIGEISTLSDEGNRKIKTQDVIKSLRWDEHGPNEQAKELDLFVDATVAEIRNIAGRDGELIANDNGIEAYWVEIYNAVDGDTFDFNVIGTVVNGKYTESGNTILGSERNRLRLTGANSFEDKYKHVRDPDARALLSSDPGVRATDFAREKLEGAKVAIRINKSRVLDEYGRVLGYVFHNTPDSVGGDEDEESRRNYLMTIASGYPIYESDDANENYPNTVGALRTWNSFTEDGKPLTFDWDLIINGHGNTIGSPLFGHLPSSGVRGDDYGTEPDRESRQ